ncbi:MAG: AmmeMemoRadiSam system protein B [Bacteroidota bacterium]|nr:AmmeMemoRadiSam system protein B [Bacteroidota bacterium]
MNDYKARKTTVAGSFYPAIQDELKADVLRFLANAQAKKSNTWAVVSPHAGYVFSGQVAANAIAQFDSEKKYENVFVIGVSHHKSLKGASVYNLGNYVMPGFEINVNTQLATDLISSSEVFFCDEKAHIVEHSLEVQLPFLYYHLKKDFKIVPILIGTKDPHVLQKIAEILKPYFNKNNLFVISTDFSHYPNYKNAVENDKRTADAFISNNPRKFMNVIDANFKKRILNLATSACGSAALLVLLYLTEKQSDYKYEIIDYKNSGNSQYGEKDRVVGYYAISLRKKEQFDLLESEKEKLIEIARNTLSSYISEEKIPKIDEVSLSDNLKKNIGAFVTLTKKGKLRGCIGQFMPNLPLWRIVQDLAISAATQDSRFSPVTIEELDDVKIEISVLTPLQKISSADEVELGRDGIYIKKDSQSGTLLPQVATENNWDKYEFLEYCSEHKAQLGKNGWKNADLFIYQSIIFHETNM